jgi:hypothetical protein
MRIWSLHPKHLDAVGLVALWREALLAQKVLLGGTRGYRHHPQLQRFRERPDPAAAVAAYLRAVHDEACARGYRFDRSKIPATQDTTPVPVSDGQLRYEWDHLLAKLRQRSPAEHARQCGLAAPETHPLFFAVPGPIAAWERP